MDGMLALLNAAAHGHPTAMAVCSWWVDNYGCLPDASTDTNEQPHTFAPDIGVFFIFPPK